MSFRHVDERAHEQKFNYCVLLTLVNGTGNSPKMENKLVETAETRLALKGEFDELFM